MESISQPLLGRKRVTMHIDFEKATPQYGEVRKKVAADLKVAEDVLAIQHVYGTFGQRKAKVVVNVYDSKEQLAKIEPKPKAKKEVEKKA